MNITPNESEMHYSTFGEPNSNFHTSSTLKKTITIMYRKKTELLW